MEIRVKVKSLKIVSYNKRNKYYVSFEPLDKTTVCNENVSLGMNDNKEITKISEYKLLDKEASNSLFNFISTHSKECFFITVDENYEVIGVSLIYG